MSLDIRHVMETGYYQRVVAFAKAINKYALEVPQPSLSAYRYWMLKTDVSTHIMGDRGVCKVLANPHDGQVHLVDVPESPMVTAVPFWMAVDDLRATHIPTNWHPDNRMTFLAHAFEYLDGYVETRSWGGEHPAYQEFGATRTTLFSDHAPASFGFLIEREQALLPGTWNTILDGGLIYHGPTDGWGEGADKPSLAVTLTDVHGWAIHT